METIRIHSETPYPVTNDEDEEACWNTITSPYKNPQNMVLP